MRGKPDPARAPKSELIPRPDGRGALMAPWTAASGAAAGRTPWRASKKVAIDLLREATPEAANRLIAMINSPDERVAAVAAAQILDRTLGKPDAHGQGGQDAMQAVDISHLTAEERGELGAALATVYRLTGMSVL